MQDQTPRGFKTDFEQHKGLLHNFARTSFARLRASGVHVEYEDVFQEACISFAQALKTYDAARGITFTAYMGRAVVNNLGRYCTRLLKERAELGMYVSDELVEDHAQTAIDEGSPTPDRLIERRQGMQAMLAALSPLSRSILTDLANPSKEVREFHNFARQQAEYAKSIGVRAWSVPADINLRTLYKYYRLGPAERRQVKNEFKQVLGVTVS